MVQFKERCIRLSFKSPPHSPTPIDLSVGLEICKLLTKGKEQRQEVDGFSQGSRRGCNGIPGHGVTVLLQADKGSEIQSRALPRGHGLQSLPCCFSVTEPAAAPAEGWTGSFNTEIDTQSPHIPKAQPWRMRSAPAGREDQMPQHRTVRKYCPVQLGPPHSLQHWWALLLGPLGGSCSGLELGVTGGPAGLSPLHPRILASCCLCGPGIPCPHPPSVFLFSDSHPTPHPLPFSSH